MIKVITVGCRLNQTEGEKLAGLTPLDIICKIHKEDQTIENYLTGDNLVIVNTCAVTREAVSTSWKKIRQQIKSSEVGGSKVIVTGCLATLEKEKMLETTGIAGVITQSEKIKLLESESGDTALISRSRPMIKIQDGCSNNCSYCIARIIRGKPMSVTPQKIKNEINHWTDLGYQEIVLTGLNLGYYGQDIGYSLSQLIESLNGDSYRIRLSSIEPDTITDELLDLFKSKNICRHLHIPLQSGDDRILKTMRRKYTADDYRKLIEKIYNKIPGINIGTDVIVGFPYEDELAFSNTQKFINELPFGYLHVFPYSLRPGTEAAKLPDNVKPEIKKERVRIMRQIRSEKIRVFREQFIGKTLDVLVEENSTGMTDNYIRINLPKNEHYQKGHLYKMAISNLLLAINEMPASTQRGEEE